MDVRKVLINLLKTQRQISKRQLLKSIVPFIKHANVQLYSVYPARIMWKNPQETKNTSIKEFGVL